MSSEIKVLIAGKSKTGKSTCLRNLSNVLYINCEAGKALPFKANDFKTAIIVHTNQIEKAFEHFENSDHDYMVIDGFNYLMEMFVSLHIADADDGRAAWGEYAQYLKRFMQQHLAQASKPVIVTAHTQTLYNESSRVLEEKVPIQGASKNTGVESYFTTCIHTRKMKIDELEGYENDLLTITDRDKLLGYKHVFQTMVTADTVNHTISSPMGMFSDAETFIDSDALILMNRMKEYYGN